MNYDLKFCKERLKIWLDAEAAVATGQSYSIGSRSLTRANLNDIREQIKYWSNQIAAIEQGTGGGRRVMRIIPRDL